jgi:hypothetical protein
MHRATCVAARNILQRATCVLHKSETHQTSNLEKVETSQRKPRLKGPIRCAICPQLGASLRRVCVQERSTECFTHMPRRAQRAARDVPHPSSICRRQSPQSLAESSSHVLLNTAASHSARGKAVRLSARGRAVTGGESAQTKADPHSTHVHHPRLAKAIPAMLDSVP